MKDRISVAGRSLRYLAISAVFTIVVSIAASVSDAQTLKPVYQVNCGGPAVGTFSADTYFQGGTPYGLNAAIDTSAVSNGPPPQVYNSQRYGNFTYSFPNLTPNAQYVVRLHFAETYFADPRPGRYNTAQAGQRVFNVSINRRVALDHFDILASSKFNQGVVKEFAITADDFGKIEMIFQNVVTNAFVNAIEILQGTSSSAGQLSAAPVLAASQIPMTGAALQAEDARIERLAEIAARLQDEKTDAVPLLTEAVGLMGFSIQTEEHARLAPPKAGPALHLAITDSEIKGYSELFRRHNSVSLADLINTLDYSYRSMGSKTSCRAEIVNWLERGTDSDNASIRALVAFLQDLSVLRPNNNFSGFDRRDVELDPIQTLLIVRVVTEDMTAPVRKAMRRRAQLNENKDSAGVRFANAAYKDAPPGICGDEENGWAEDGFVGVLNGIYEQALEHAKEASKYFGESAELYKGETGRINALSALTKFILTYTYLEGDLEVEAPGEPLIRTKDRRPGDTPRTVAAKFRINGRKLTDFLKEHRCALALLGIDTDMPKSGDLKGIETAWRVGQDPADGKRIIQTTKAVNLDRVPVEEQGEDSVAARVEWTGAPQRTDLDPKKVMPYTRSVPIYVTPQAKHPEIKQDLVDAILGVYGAREGGPGLLTPIYEQLYRLKWKGTISHDLRVRDWMQDFATGGLTIRIQASGHLFRPTSATVINLDRQLDFTQTQMKVVAGGLPPGFDPNSKEMIAQLPEYQRAGAEKALEKEAEMAKKQTFIGTGPGKIKMSFHDSTFTRSAVEDCEVVKGERQTNIDGVLNETDFELGSFPPDMTLFRVDVDVEKKTAVVQGDYNLLVRKIVTETADKQNIPHAPVDEKHKIFQNLKILPPFDGKNGITIPVKEDQFLTQFDNGSGYGYSGSVMIPFTFGNGHFKADALFSFYVWRRSKDQ